MHKVKSSLILCLNHILSGIILSGMPEFFGYINPWLVLAGIVYLGYLISLINKPGELLYLIGHCVGYYLFYNNSLPDVIDSFLLIDSIWVNVFINVFIAVLVKIPMFWKPIIRVLMHKFNFKMHPVWLVALTMLITLFMVYVTFGWSANIAYTLSNWTPYLIWLPIFGSAIYVYFISLIVGLLSFNLNNKFLISLTMIFIVSHVFPNFKIEKDEHQKINIGVVQYPYYLLNHQQEPPDILKLKQQFSSLMSSVRADFIIFPESSALFILDDAHSWITNPYLQAIKKSESNIILSGYKKENDIFYNTSIFLRKESIPQIYYKNKLFPVGEALVWGISNFNSGPFASSLSRKVDHSVWKINGFTIVPLLCFENFHNYFWVIRLQQAKTAVQITTLQSNEGWVKDKLMRKILLQYTQIQAKEMGVYVAKADTAGPSAIIGPSGEIVKASSEPIAVLQEDIPKLKHNSFYSRHGIFPFLMVVLIQLLVLLFLKKKN